jgi:hypothetical protein
MTTVSDSRHFPENNIHQIPTLSMGFVSYSQTTQEDPRCQRLLKKILDGGDQHPMIRTCPDLVLSNYVQKQAIHILQINATTGGLLGHFGIECPKKVDSYRCAIAFLRCTKKIVETLHSAYPFSPEERLTQSQITDCGIDPNKLFRFLTLIAVEKSPKLREYYRQDTLSARSFLSDLLGAQKR